MKRGEQVPDDILQRIIEQGLLTHAAELFYAGFAGTQPYPAYCLHLFISSFIQSLTQRLIHSFILHVWIHLFTYLFSILFFYFLLSFDNIFLRLDYIVIAKVSRLLIYLNVEWADNPLHACFLFFVFFFFMEFQGTNEQKFAIISVLILIIFFIYFNHRKNSWGWNWRNVRWLCYVLHCRWEKYFIEI